MEAITKKHLSQFANILARIRKEYHYSNDFASLESDFEYFDDVFKFVGLIRELHELEDTFRNMIKYSEMSEEV